MKPPDFLDAQAVPLLTDADIEKRVTELIGRANLRQFWVLFLDAEAVQLPLLIPIDGMPSEPSRGETLDVMERIRGVMDEIGAASIILVWERYAAARLTAQDAAWARSLHETCAEQRIELRAMLLSHRSGVRWVAQDDYRFASNVG
jgi:sugar phosphate isomerase/epimerase